MKQFDYLIIGGGIAGASVAFELSKLGTVAVLEREDSCGYHATGRSAALFVRCYGNSAVQQLTEASASFFCDPPSGFSENSLLEPRPCLYIGRPGEEEDLDRFFVENKNMPIERVATHTIEQLTPVLKAGYAIGGILERNSCGIEVNSLLDGYLRGARRMGAQIENSIRITSIQRQRDGFVVQTEHSTYYASVVVNAAGAWADEVALMAGLSPIGLTPLRRTAMLIDPPTAENVSRWPMVVAIDESFYYKPEAGKILASPGDETPSLPCDARPDELDIAICAERIEEATILKIKRISHSWAGLRTFSHDRAPVIGFDSSDAGFFWLAGQGGFGIQTAPAAARIAAALASRGNASTLIESYGLTEHALSPSRFKMG